MSRTAHISAMIAHAKQHRKTSLLKGLLAVGPVLLIAAVRFISGSFPLIYHISLFYLLVVIALALLFGRAVALLAAVTAFICLDFLYISPIYTLNINQPDDMLSLLFFLLVAVSMCLLGSESRNRNYQAQMNLVRERQKNAEDTLRHDRNIHIMYNILKETGREKTLKAQLSIIAKAITENLEPLGVHGCILLLPNKENQALPEASWPESSEVKKLLDGAEMRHAAQRVMLDNQNISLAIEGTSFFGRYHDNIRRTVPPPSSTAEHSVQHYAYLMPLPLIHGNRAVLLLILDQCVHAADLVFEQSAEQKQADMHAGFLRQCIEHIETLVEKARLQDEKLDLELLRRTEKLHMNLNKWVSHGIRTPLTGLLLETDKALGLLHKNAETTDDMICASLTRIRASAGRLDLFVDDFLDFARAKGGLLNPHKSLCFIDELIDETLQGMLSVIANRTIERHIPDDLPPLELDPNQIGHVLTNLIENASRHTPPGTPIEISAQIQNAYMQISVADRGQGIRHQDKQRLFDEFYQGKAANPQGKGLGLATCQALIKAHEGKIDIDNRDGGGAIFYFTLPLTTDHTDHKE